MGNGGFEQGQVGWQSGYWASGVAAIIEDGSSPEGVKHLKLSSNNDDWYNVTQDITVEPGETYDVRFRANVISATDTWDAFVKLAWKDGANYVDLQSAYNPSVTAVGWQSYTFSFQSGEHTDLTFFIGGHASTWEVDAVSIKKREKEPEPPKPDHDLFLPMPKSLLANGGFENGQTDWTSNDFNTGVAAILEEGSPEGTKHLYFSDHDANTWFSANQTIAVEQNATYEVTFRCKVTDSSTVWGVYSKLGKPDGSDLQPAYNPDINVSGWQNCSYTFSTGDSTSLTFYIGGNQSTFEVDDIQIKKVSGLVTSINESRDAIRADGAYTLTGNISKPSVVRVTVNGVALEDVATTGSNNAFSVPLTLLGGCNTITVTAAAGTTQGEPVTFALYGQKVTVSEVQTIGSPETGSAFGYSFDVANLTAAVCKVTAVLEIHDANNTLRFLTYTQTEVPANETQAVTVQTDALPNMDGCTAQVRLMEDWNSLVPYPQRDAIE